MSFSTAARRPSSSSRFSVVEAAREILGSDTARGRDHRIDGRQRAAGEEPAAGRGAGERQRGQPDQDQQEARPGRVDAGERHGHLHEMDEASAAHDREGEQPDGPRRDAGQRHGLEGLAPAVGVAAARRG